jgi:membrane protein YqaA with SNARE-associated domain
VSKYVHRLLTVIIFAIMGVVAVALWRGQIPIEWLASFGYKGLFVLSLINGIAPVGGPSQIATFFVASKLNPLVVGLTAGTGGALGELAGYAFGYSFRASQSEAIEQKFQRIANWKFIRISRERSFIPLFVLASIPNPFFDPASALAGSLKIGIAQYFVPVLLGKIFRHLVIAVIGYYALTRVNLVLTKDSMTEFLNSGWFVIAVVGIAVLVWGVRSIAESEPDPFVLNFTFFAFAGQCVLTAELAKQDKVSATILGLALAGIIILLAQIFVFRGHFSKTIDHYKELLKKHKPDKYNDAEIERWADVIVRITGVDFWPQLYKGWSKGFGSGPRGKRRSQALMMLKEGEFDCTENGITEEKLTVPENDRKWPWRLHAFLCFLSWVVFVACIQAAKGINYGSL